MRLTTTPLHPKGAKTAFYLIEKDGKPAGYLSQKRAPKGYQEPLQLFLYKGEFRPGSTDVELIGSSYNQCFAYARRELLLMAADELAGTSHAILYD
jgi:hypothetical protein